MEHDGALLLELVDFVVNNNPYYRGKERRIEKVIKNSLEYGIGDYGVDDGGIVYVLRFNLSDDLKIAHIIDLIIREDKRGSVSLIKYVIARNWTKHPYLEEIRFDRQIKYPEREIKKYRLIKFFNKGKKNGKNRDSSTLSTVGTVSGSERC